MRGTVSAECVMLLPFEILNKLVALSAVWMELFAAALLALFFLRKREWARALSDVAARGALLVGAALSWGAIAVSLYYSEVLGFEPCGLCWMIRVFSYPLAFLFTLAWWRGDEGIVDYAISLAVPGLLIALYQHYLQMGGTEVVGCPATGGTADCAARFLFEFGHVTFPWLAVAYFLLIIALMLHLRSLSSAKGLHRNPVLRQ